MLLKSVLENERALFSTDGEKLYKVIQNYLDTKKHITLDFSGMIVCGTAFIKTGIGEIYKNYSQEVVKKYITFTNVDSITQYFIDTFVPKNEEVVEVKVEEEKSILEINLQAFLNGHEKKTFYNYNKWINYYMKYLKESNIIAKNANKNDFKNYKKSLIERGLSNSTINCYLIAVKEFYGYLQDNDICEDITSGTKNQRTERRFKKGVLNEEELKTILNSMPRNSILESRNFAIINLLIRTGLRTEEVVNCNVSDLKEINGSRVLFIKGKGRTEKEEYVLLKDEAYFPIIEYLNKRPKAIPLFVSESRVNKGKKLTTSSIRHIVSDTLKSAGINRNNISAHSFRHSFATIALKNGAEIYYVKEALRHKNISTTELYIKPISRQEKGAENFINID